MDEIQQFLADGLRDGVVFQHRDYLANSSQLMCAALDCRKFGVWKRVNDKLGLDADIVRLHEKGVNGVVVHRSAVQERLSQRPELENQFQLPVSNTN